MSAVYTRKPPKFVQLTIDGGIQKKYYFHYDPELNLMEGDKVVAHTSYGLQIATVRGFSEESNVKVHKWVVDKIDMKSHEDRLERERLSKEVRQKMEKRRKELEEISVYQILAKEDPMMAELLDRLNALNS